MKEPLVRAQSLRVAFPVRRGALRRAVGEVVAVDDVSLSIGHGESFALVGESGSGKTTLARALLRLVELAEGTVHFDGVDLLALSPAELRRRRRDFQMVFQDPLGSLDPRYSVRQTVEEPLRIHRLAQGGRLARRVEELLELVGLPAKIADRFPHELSGGQRQRVCVARALASEPKLLVADEPVSALDVSIRAQIVNLLASLQEDLGLTLFFIGHDLALVEQLADRVAVMYLGRIVEQSPAAELFAKPLHPYTVSLLAAVPAPEPGLRRPRIVLLGDPPSPSAPPAGCRFHPRCPIAQPRCGQQQPPLVEVQPGRWTACFYPGELAVQGALPPGALPPTGAEAPGAGPAAVE
ncbi:MAG TPA: ABC transporter ATP-binding protein [Thermoanaerobaculia bacterium]|nr:ABC transporter ATP-binding protein [Thermoanaerobaculia bacterium]